MICQWQSEKSENLTLINRLPSDGDSQVNSVGIINVSMGNDY